MEKTTKQKRRKDGKKRQNIIKTKNVNEQEKPEN